MKKIIISALSLLAVSNAFSQPRESLSDKVRQAFSLVGHWEITKMEVDRSGEVHNPNTVPETSMGQVSITVRSELGDYGSFDIAPGGAISGNGEVIYQYRVAAGTSSFSWGPVNLPIGAVAMMSNDNGIRRFTITGNADLSARTISLRAFQPQGNALNMIIRPGGRQFTSVLWPPMTNISPTKVMVTGSSLLLRASGVLSGIKVTFEAVKYVDLAGLFSSIETFVTETVNNVTNTTYNSNNSNPSNNSNNSNPTTTEPTTEQPGGSSAPIAGFVTLQPGQSAVVVFRAPQAAASYAIALTPMNLANTNVTALYSDKTVTGFKIHLKGTGTGAVRVDWVVTPYNN